MRPLVIALLAALAVTVPAPAAQAAPHPLTNDVDLEVVASGLSLAVDLAAPPGDDRLFIVEKVGRIRILQDGVVLSAPFLDITGPVLSSANEQGLLGLAFPPDYAASGLFYVYYTADAGNGDTVVAEYSVGANPNVADAGSGRVLLTLDQPYSNHNAGAIHFGPDGYLYVALGDGGGGGDPGENGQNKATLLGTILRLDPATGEAAPGNPFVGKAGADEVWLYGLRNPWRFSFDAATGDMYIGDVGQGAVEEVDVIPAGESGLNLGWDAYEGSNCYEGPCDPTGLTFPVLEYGHGPGAICGSNGGAITGGYVYRGNELPWLRGHYFYADWCLGTLKSFRLAGDQVRERIDWTQTLSPPGLITSFGVDGFGELYFTAQGKVYKFVSTRGPGCDFDSDGYGDVAVGVPGERYEGTPAAGRALTVAGRAAAIDPSDDTLLRPGTGGVPGPPGSGARFGSALACGDFDGDGYTDLAVGAPGAGGGAVYVVGGGPGGPDPADSVVVTQATLGVGTAAAGDSFGAALASGDLNRDRYTDLVIGAPGDGEAGPAASGSVTILYGSASGLDLTGAQLLHQDVAGIKDRAEPGDMFGASVAVGDVDGDGFDDVVAGIPGEGVAGESGAGAIAVLFGRKPMVGKRDVWLHRNTAGIRGDAVSGAGFGSTVAVGHFDNDGFDDLAVGVPRTGGDGAVQVIAGGPGGPSKRDSVFRQGVGGIAGNGEPGDGFGAALATGDADGDGFDELAIGAPGEDHHGAADAGIVGVLPGGVAGLSAAGYRQWHQAVPNVKGAVAADDGFGSALRFIDTRGDGTLDLVIGSPQQQGGGELNWLQGTPDGITQVGDRRWSQDTTGVIGSSQPGDRFGAAL